MFHKILMVHILSSSKVKTDVCILHASWWRTYLNCISLKSSQYGGSNVVLYHSNNIYSRNQMETWIQLVRIRISKSDTYIFGNMTAVVEHQFFVRNSMTQLTLLYRWSTFRSEIFEFWLLSSWEKNDCGLTFCQIHKRATIFTQNVPGWK